MDKSEHIWGSMFGEVPCPGDGEGGSCTVRSHVRRCGEGVFLYSEIPCLGDTGRGGICTVRSPVWGKMGQGQAGGPCTVRSHVRGAGVGEDPCMVRSNASW